MSNDTKTAEGLSRSLFLDRDGVLNRRIVDSYVTRPEDFDILPGVLEAIALMSKVFKHIFIVTNQQGIGKGLMSEADLKAIHDAFVAQVEQAGGRIDRIYHCPALKEEHSFCRKPSIGMAIKARHDYPDIRLKDCVMVGDMAGDMLFGRRAGMTTVLVGSEVHVAREHPELVDFYYPTLLDYALKLKMEN